MMRIKRNRFLVFLGFIWSVGANAVHGEPFHQCIQANGTPILTDRPCQKNEQSKPLSQHHWRQPDQTQPKESPAVTPKEIKVAAMEIPMVASSRPGEYVVEVKLNNAITGHFIIDTGATNMLISEQLQTQLMRDGGATPKDRLPPKKHQLADGSIVELPGIHIQQVTLGSFTIENVAAAVGKPGIQPLLGANILERFGKWHIDWKKNVLIIGEQKKEVAVENDQMMAESCQKWMKEIDSRMQEINNIVNENNDEVKSYNNARQTIQEEINTVNSIKKDNTILTTDQLADIEKRNSTIETLAKQHSDNINNIKNKVENRKNNIKKIIQTIQSTSIKYNKQCPGRMYQDNHNAWMTFKKIDQLPDENKMFPE